MFELSFFPIYGAALGFHYSNDEIEATQESYEDKANILQLYLLFVCVNVVWFTKREE